MIFSRICRLLAFLATVVVSTTAWYQNPGVQAVLKAPASDILDSNNAARPPTTYLSSIRDSEFTSFTHPRFPNHRVRIKKTNFCDPTVQLVSS